MSDDTIPVNFGENFFTLNHQQFEHIYTSNTQFIWGIIAAVPQHTEPDPQCIARLSAEDPDIWKINHFLIHESVIEITAFDSSYTIVKFKDRNLSDKFKDYFQDEAIDLDYFNKKYLS